MRTLIQIFILLGLFISCDNETDIPKIGRPFLDSLISGDSIVGISLYCPEPKYVNEQPLSDSIAIIKEDMYIDSVLRWATSKEAIDAFVSAFPRLYKTDRTNWDTVTRIYNEILIFGKNKTYSVFWVLGNKDSLVAFDEATFSVDKTLLAKASQFLDRKIITKEIYKKDLAYYDTADFYNRYYLPIQDTNRPRRDKMFVYILE